MSILNYFKPLPQDDTLPDPDGALSIKVPSQAIAAANRKVSEAIEGAKSRGPYITLTPAQRLTVGKRAAEHGTTAAIRFFSKKYPELALKEATVRRLKNLYQSQLSITRNLRRQESDTNLEGLQELPPKKSGRPLMIGDELDKLVREYISDLRSRGTTINTAIVLASAEGIIMYKDANLLSTITLTKGWAKYLLKRMGFVKRKSTSKSKVTVENFEDLKEDFLLVIKQVIAMDEIPADLVINFDQTDLNYVPVSDWTMEAEGAKRVEIAGKNDKRQLTAVLAGSMTGNFLPPQVIYQGKTQCCLPQYQFPPKWHITYSINHWSNEDTMKEYIEQIILPYVAEKRKNLKLADKYPALLIFDNFKAQCTPAILTLLDLNNINVVLIPPNCTDRLQPLDLSVNKSVKSYLRSQFQAWYAKEICSQLQGCSEKRPVDLRLSIVKPLGAAWMVSLYDYLKSKPDIIRNGFKEAGILDCLLTTS